MTARFEQPGAKIPSTPEEVAAYLARRIERLTVEASAHLRIADTIAALRRERGAEVEGDDILARLQEEATVAAERAARAATQLRRDCDAD